RPSPRSPPRAQETALATRSEATVRGCGLAAPAGSVVRTTHTVSVAESAHTSVPDEPEWPKVFSEQPGLPDLLPTAKPSPRGAKPSGLWFLTIRRAVSGFIIRSVGCRNSA